MTEICVNDIANLMDGWTELHVYQYVDELNRFVQVYNDDGADIPFDVATLEVTRVSVDGNALKLECE